MKLKPLCYQLNISSKRLAGKKVSWLTILQKSRHIIFPTFLCVYENQDDDIILYYSIYRKRGSTNMSKAQGLRKNWFTHTYYCKLVYGKNSINPHMGYHYLLSVIIEEDHRRENSYNKIDLLLRLYHESSIRKSLFFFVIDHPIIWMYKWVKYLTAMKRQG